VLPHQNGLNFMTLIDPDTVLKTDNSQIDSSHAEFTQLLNQMSAANNLEFAKLFAELLTHTEQHFQEENRLMEQSGFPAQTEHKAEHQRILGELTQFKKRLDKGLVAFARAYATEKLPAWFTLHLSTADSALVEHLIRALKSKDSVS
jgi:hemerythrin-like metal-binding protein